MSADAHFDEVVHAPVRLRICAALAVTSSIEFVASRSMLDVADSVLSEHLEVLADADYVRLVKTAVQGGRARTRVALTPRGVQAVEGHLAALRELSAAVDGRTGAPGVPE